MVSLFEKFRMAGSVSPIESIPLNLAPRPYLPLTQKALSKVRSAFDGELSRITSPSIAQRLKLQKATGSSGENKPRWAGMAFAGFQAPALPCGRCLAWGG